MNTVQILEIIFATCFILQLIYIGVYGLLTGEKIYVVYGLYLFATLTFFSYYHIFKIDSAFHEITVQTILTITTGIYLQFLLVSLLNEKVYARYYFIGQKVLRFNLPGAFIAGIISFIPVFKNFYLFYYNLQALFVIAYFFLYYFLYKNGIKTYKYFIIAGSFVLMATLLYLRLYIGGGQKRDFAGSSHTDYYGVSLIALVVESILFTIGLQYRQFALQAEKHKLESTLLKKEIKLIKNRFNSHFINNAFSILLLNLGSSDETKKVRLYIKDLAGYFRNILNITEKNTHSLEDELDFTEGYIKLQQSISVTPFSYKILIDDDFDTYSLLVPPMLLQPFVENAIKHGFAGMDYPGEISIYATFKDDMPIIKIVDNGKGINAGKLIENVGLSSTQQHLQLLSGDFDKKFISLYQNVSSPGTTVEIILPVA